jgi:hypothetical protein
MAQQPPTHYLIRIGDGKNFQRSMHFKIWGTVHRIDAKKGDVLWFITSKSQGHAVAVATFVSTNPRDTRDLISGTLPNSMLGWDGPQTSRYEIHYDNLIDIRNCNVFTRIKSQCSIRKYTRQNFEEGKCSEPLETIYPYIRRFSNAINMH